MMKQVVILSLLAAMSALYAQGPNLIVLLKGGSGLSYYTAEDKLLATMAVGTHPHEMVLSPDYRRLFISNNGTMRIEESGPGGNTVSVVDVHARKQVGLISTGSFRRPHGLDLDPHSGRLAISCELPDQLVLADAATAKVIRTYDPKGKTAHMVRFGPGGAYAYVSNSGSATVSAIRLDDGAVTVIPVGERPEGSVLSPDGKLLYVCNREGHSISIIDTATQALAGRISTGNGPVRVDMTPDGLLLVYAVMHDKAIELAETKTGKVVGRVALDGSPVSLHLSRDGRLAFASAEADDTVYVVSVVERRILRQFHTAKGAGPDPVMELPAVR